MARRLNIRVFDKHEPVEETVRLKLRQAGNSVVVDLVNEHGTVIEGLVKFVDEGGQLVIYRLGGRVSSVVCRDEAGRICERM